MSETWINTFFNQSKDEFSDKNVTIFTNGDGFSMVSEYNNIHKRQFGIRDDEGIAPFIKVYFDIKRINEFESYVPVIIQVSATSREIQNGQQMYILNVSRKRFIKPIDYVSKDDFYISKHDGKIYERKKTKYILVSFDIFYSRLYKAHLK